ncbi:MAG: putative LPS assembly protein LptD, partial [Tannerellaceae bacterium]
QNMVAADTTYGFYRVFNYSASISASTTMYGFYKPLPILGDKIQMIRHRVDPSVSFSAAPDFGDPSYGFFKDFGYTDQYGEERHITYSPFQHQLFGVPSTGKQGNVSFNLDNNLEMKIRSDRDSSGFRKISLIDKLSLGMSYNMAADSFQWSDLNVGLRIKFSKSYTLNLTGVFDTYTYGYNAETNNVYRRNVLRWNDGKGIGRLKSTGTSFSYTFNNETFKKLFAPKEDKEGEKKKSADDTNPLDPENTNPDDATVPEEKGGRLRGAKKETSEWDADGYMITKVPWSLSFNYSMRLGYGKFNPSKMEYDYRITNSLSFNGNIQPTKNWRLNFSATYDFDAKKITYMTCNITRDMHCFQMSA